MLLSCFRFASRAREPELKSGGDYIQSEGQSDCVGPNLGIVGYDRDSLDQHLIHHGVEGLGSTDVRISTKTAEPGFPAVSAIAPTSFSKALPRLLRARAGLPACGNMRMAGCR